MQRINQEGTDMEMANTSTSAGKKESKGMMMGMMICAVLAIAGIGFGVYGMTRKPEEKLVENNTAELEDELSALRQKYSVLQNYVNELEASGVEVPEEVKSAPEETATIKPFIPGYGKPLNVNITDNTVATFGSNLSGLGEAEISREDAHKVTFKIYNNEMNSWVGRRLSEESMEQFTVEFDKRVAGVYIGGYGSTSIFARIILVMEDGTIKVSKLDSDDFVNHIFKDVEGISGVVTILTGGTYLKDAGTQYVSGSTNTFAVRANGDYYILSDYFWNDDK